MTLAALLAALRAVAEHAPAAWAWARRHTTLVLVAVIAVLVLLLALALGRARDAEGRVEAATATAQAEAKRDAERVVLEASGALVAERMARIALEQRAGLLEQRLGAADAEIARLRKAGARPVAVVDLSTGPVPAAGQTPQVVAGGADSHTPPTAGPDSRPATSCLLHAGDTGELRAAGVVYETAAGNVVPIVAAEAWRLLPGPEERILAGRLSLGALTVPEPALPPPPAPRQGGILGLGGGIGTSGRLSVAGLGVTPPVRLPLFGTRVRAWVVPEFVPGPGTPDLRALGGAAVEYGGGR